MTSPRARKLAAISLVPLSFVFAAAAAANDVQFSAPETIPVPDAARGAVLFDLEGDGDLDLALAHAVFAAPGIVSLHENVGGGVYVQLPDLALPDWGDAIQASDVDQDGDSDLVVVMTTGIDTVATFLNDGTGAFTGPILSSGGNLPFQLDVDDLDGDGLPDLALANWSQASVSILFGNGAGGFGNERIFVLDPTDKSFGVDLADIDGDQDRDVLVASFDGDVTVIENQGAGAFGVPEDYAMGFGCWHILALDMDRDGDLDLVSTNRNTGDVAVRKNSGLGTFGPKTATPVGEFPLGTAAADFRGSGTTDLVVVETGGPVTVLLGDDDAGFSVGLSRDTQGWTQAEVLTGDVDGDGDEDFAHLWSGGELTLYRNTTIQDDSFLLRTTHLVAGNTAELTVEDGQPAGAAVLLASFTGADGGPYIPSFDVTTDLTMPRRAGMTVILDAAGEGTFEFHLPAALAGTSTWFQAIQFQDKSNVVATTIH